MLALEDPNVVWDVQVSTSKNGTEMFCGFCPFSQLKWSLCSWKNGFGGNFALTLVVILVVAK